MRIINKYSSTQFSCPLEVLFQQTRAIQSTILILISNRLMMSRPEPPQVDYKYIKASAPSKFILSGEYSVVFDKQAIAFSVNLKTNVVIEPNSDNFVRLHLESFKQIREWPVYELNNSPKLVRKAHEIYEFPKSGWPAMMNFLLSKKFLKSSDCEGREKMADDATKAFLLLYLAVGDSYRNSARAPISVKVSSEIPPGSGLGSSSSYAVALCGSILRVYRVMAEKHIIASWALNIDKYFHGKPSGIDTNIITHGGCVLFQSSKIRQQGIRQATKLKVLLIDSGVSRSTKDLIERVSQKRTDDPQKCDTIFDNINVLTAQIWRLLNDPSCDLRNIFPLINQNQELLDDLGVGHQKLNQIITACSRLDLCCKLTGAGGGGFAFTIYLEEQEEAITRLKENLSENNFCYYDVEAGVEGLNVTIIKE